MASYTTVAKLTDITPGSGHLVEVEGHQIALFNVDGSILAIGNACTHRGGSLAEGSLQGTTVTCPLHGATFDVCTGKNLSPPALREIPCYTVHIEGDAVQIEI